MCRASHISKGKAMRKFLRKSLVAAAAAIGIGLTAVPAHAGPPWEVVGDSPTGNYTATSTDTRYQFQRGAPTTTISCGLVVLHMNIPDQIIPAPGRIGSIVGAQWTNCTGASITFALSASLPWALNVVADSTNPNAVLVSLSGVDVTLQGAGLPCTARLQGTVPGQYDNSTQTLTLNPSFGVNSFRVTAANCFGIFQPGDVVGWLGTFVVTPRLEIRR
jgi:hypothetical protein